MSRHQLPGYHRNPLTLADGLSNKDSQEIYCSGEGGRKIGSDSTEGVGVKGERTRANTNLCGKGQH